MDEPVYWPEVEPDLLGVTVPEILPEEDRVLEGEAEELGQCDSVEEVVWEFVFLELVDGLLELEGLDESVDCLVKVNPGETVFRFVRVEVWLCETEAVDEYESWGDELSELENEEEPV